MFSIGFTSLSVLRQCLTFLYRSYSSSLRPFFDSISSNTDEIVAVFAFGGFYIHHNYWLIFSGGTDRPGEFCYNFSISNDLTQIVNFPTRTPDCDSHSRALLDFFLFSDTSICYTMVLPPLGNSEHGVASVYIDVPSNSKRALHKKRIFPLRLSSVNMTKFTVSRGFGHIY